MATQTRDEQTLRALATLDRHRAWSNRLDQLLTVRTAGHIEDLAFAAHVSDTWGMRPEYSWDPRTIETAQKMVAWQDELIVAETVMQTFRDARSDVTGVLAEAMSANHVARMAGQRDLLLSNKPVMLGYAGLMHDIVQIWVSILAWEGRMASTLLAYQHGDISAEEFAAEVVFNWAWYPQKNGQPVLS